ncbi:MAG: chloride channel protein [Thermodesulfobacteria bacterium]|nr:chloride channel protein [Thermodesulfobacteriota bacterium]
MIFQLQKKFIKNVRQWLHLRRLLLLAVPTGIIAGLGSVFFFIALDFSRHIFLDYMAGYRPEGPGGEHPLFPPTSTPFIRWMLLVVPTLGGIISGWLIYTFAPEAEGHGTDAALESYHFKDAIIRARVPIIKTIASAITIGSGGSGGREGPIAQIGAGFGSIIAQKLHLSTQERRILMMAGMSAGIGSIFHAPLAGAIFAAEILYRDIDMEYELLVPSAITSVVAYCVFSLFFGFGTLFKTPHYVFHHSSEILPYTVLAVAVAYAARFYARVFYFIRDLFLKLPTINHIKPAIGGFLTGVIGYFLPGAIYTGYGVLQQAFEGKLMFTTLLLIAFGKIFATAFSIGSGGSGGVFGPSVVIGGTLGGAVGLALQRIWPSLVPNPEAYVIVGMAGFFASAASTPFSTVIMVSEMTGNYALLLPAVWVSTLAFLLKGKKGIYEKQLTTRFDTPIHHGDFLLGILARLTVHEVLKRIKDEQPDPIPENWSLRELVAYMSKYPASCFVVVHEDGSYAGVVMAQAVRHAVTFRGLDSGVQVKDLVEERPTIFPWNSLATALKKMAEEKTDELVVLSDRTDKKVPRGIISRADILKAYDKAIYSSL